MAAPDPAPVAGRAPTGTPLLSVRDAEVAYGGGVVALHGVSLEVPEGSPVIGQRVSEISLPEGSLIISILRDGRGFVPKADTVVQDGDEVLLVLDPGLEDSITEQFASDRRDAA